MRKFMFAVAILFAAAGAQAATCEEQAAEKKLAGAAKSSFIKKCEADGKGTPAAGGAEAACNATAAEKKLAGAAKSSFVKKCVADAGKGSAPAMDAKKDAKKEEKKK